MGAQLVSEIAAVSAEQAQGIDQVNQAVSQMDKVVLNVAPNAEKSASVSEEMNAQAAQMKGMVKESVSIVGGKKGAQKPERAVRLVRSLIPL